MHDTPNHQLTGTDVRAALVDVEPEPIQQHWVDVDGKRYPPKQVYQTVTRQPRATFTSHRALSALAKLGFETTSYRRVSQRESETEDQEIERTDSGDKGLAFSALVEFLTTSNLTSHLAAAEASIVGTTPSTYSGAIEGFGFSEDLVDAALAVRGLVGRLNDVIHASVIARCLPLVLEQGEVVTVKPSLGAGNDPSRPFDLETNRRVAEFKVAQWKGADTMRKRGLFADLAHLAMDGGEKHPQLYVVGRRPRHFLETSRTRASWALARSSPTLRERFSTAYGDSITVAEFTGGPAAHVEILDLADFVPSLREDS